MTIYAYLRVSTDQQDVANQRHGLLEYANRQQLSPVQFVEDTASGRLDWRKRAVGQLLTTRAQAGDVLVFAEVSRMARSTLQVLEILRHCMEREFVVHIAKQQMVLDGSLQSRILATVLGMIAEIEREFLSQRTKEALAQRRTAGKPVGRPKGRVAAQLKLDAHAGAIQGYLAKGITKRNIAKLIECSPSTRYAWFARRR